MNIKQLISFVLVMSFTLPATAQNASSGSVPSPDKEEDVAKISPLRKGDTAPFSGILFSPRATASVVTDIETIEEKIALEVAKVKRDKDVEKQFELNESNSKCKTQKDVIQAESDAYKNRAKELEDALKIKQEETPSRLIWSGLGALGGIAVTVLITFAVNQASK